MGGETLAQAALREAQSGAHAMSGMTDVSTLAKFEISGPDAAAFLEIICATTVSKLAVGRGRYTFMLREDGFVFDDGTVWRLGENRYLLTSSTGGADRMATHLSYVRQYLCPHLRVSAVNVQEHYAGIAVAGPNAKAVLASADRRRTAAPYVDRSRDHMRAFPSSSWPPAIAANAHLKSMSRQAMLRRFGPHAKPKSPHKAARFTAWRRWNSSASKRGISWSEAKLMAA